ncbi:MAG: efflux RND transporter periplasmic adaptor subunit [Acidobacteriales bacterium]|nr:efflux RND transporter periplasmic adaptor subunit [Terriglobales bacterium]
MTNKKIWTPILVVVLIAGAYYYIKADGKAAAPYFTATVERGNIRSQVEATGTINAVTTVQVGSQVSGTISQLNVDFNSRVRKDMVVARIDDSLFQGALNQARADFENAKANLAAAKANLERSKAASVQTKADYARTEPLAREGVVSAQQLDLAKANWDSAVAQVNSSQAQVTQADAQMQQKAAAVQVAKINLDHTVITAPIDGTVIARSVDIGQTVAASLQAPTLFTIAQDLTKMLVYTKTDESDIGRIRPGQPVIFRVDAFPNEAFRGRVKEVRMNATVVQNVVTYDTIIEFDNPDRKLFPGMTAYVTIPVARADDVLKVSNGALRFKPDLKPAEIKALYAKYNIQTGGRGGDTEDDSAMIRPASAQAAAASPAAKAGDPQPKSGDGRAQGDSSGHKKGDWQGRGQRDANGMKPAQPGDQQHNGASGTHATARQSDVTEPTRTYVVWKLLPDKTLQPVKIKTGITDFTFTALVAGDLKEGDLLITGSQGARPAAGASPLGQGGGQQRR